MNHRGGHEGCAGSSGAAVGQPQQPQRWLSLGGAPGRQKQTASGGHGKRTRGGAASFAWEAAKSGCRANAAGSGDLGISSLFPWLGPGAAPRSAPASRAERTRGEAAGCREAAAESSPRREPASPRSRALLTSVFRHSDLCCCNILLAL